MNHRATLPTAALLACALAALAPAPAWAQSTFDTTFAVRGDARLSIQNQRGTVVVRAGSRGQMRIVAQYERSRPELDVTPGTVALRTDMRRGRGEAEYTVTVPAGTAVDINGMSVDVDVNDVCGNVTINTLNGDVGVRCAGDVQVVTLSGDITLGDVRGRLEATATSGEIVVRGARGGVRVNTVSGDITLTQLDGVEVDAETVSGDILYAGRIQDGGRYGFVAHSGDVTVQVAGTLNATIDIETFNGDILSDFPLQLQPGPIVNKRMTFRLGSGGARLRLNSFNGSINLRRAAGASREE